MFEALWILPQETPLRANKKSLKARKDSGSGSMGSWYAVLLAAGPILALSEAISSFFSIQGWREPPKKSLTRRKRVQILLMMMQPYHKHVLGRL